MEIIWRYPDPFPVEVISAIKIHAVQRFPEESCGLVTEEGYIPCENTHPEPLKGFRIDPEVTADALQRGAILAVVHSHPDGPNHPSSTDLANQEAHGIPWGVVPVIGVTAEDGSEIGQPEDIIWWGDQLPIPPLEGRRFVWGVMHCWNLVRHWWKLERNVDIPTFPLGPDVIDEQVNFFLDEEHLRITGMVDIGKIDMCGLQPGDMLVGHIRGQVPNHCGVYLGGDDFLHHPPMGVSGKANLLRWWPHIDTVLRYDPEKAAPLRTPSRKVRKRSRGLRPDAA